MPAKLTSLLPDQSPLRVLQSPGLPDSKLLEKCDHLVIVVPEKPAASVWQNCPEGVQLSALQRKRGADNLIRGQLSNSNATGISLRSLKGSDKGNQLPSPFELLTFCGKLATAALTDKPASIAILPIGFTDSQAIKVAEALLLALIAHNFSMPTYKSSAAEASRLTTIRLLGLNKKIDIDRAKAEADATNLTRWLTAQPPNKLNTGNYKKAITALAKEHRWSMTFLDEAKLRKLGAGAFLAVTQGNSERDAGIVHLRYRPKGTTAKTKPEIALVGKGIIFDTGGTNLKPFKSMLDMHHDMSGSAVAVATLAALSKLKYPKAVDCWLAITENKIGPTAYKSRDIVTACNGTTIEIIHTDAEGRMALADTLALAGREKPATIIDFATLTGSCVAALSDRYSGALCNRMELNDIVVRAGRESGERVWPFPFDDDFDEEIKSSVADVLQCAIGGGGDHIQAARLLKKFVPDNCAWIHVDLSAATRKGGLAQVPGEVTGFGPRFALNLIIDQLAKNPPTKKGKK